ncbi:hypothetical protein BV25DRAFT_1811403 [Artomyces pyxidatus]|uniref:Uncharacterized protein n=1 Tax=Artomyces pyxidatus TaxID=48021 RepID=A0ACB8SNU3_9AGAM|nr:hypothetical protein BV25DRAFT_1811403 [Artomyces pyxidatus]
MSSPLPGGTPSKFTRSFLHPTVSRLRSYTPQASRQPSTTSVVTFQSNVVEALSTPPSHFSDLSPMSSTANLHSTVEKHELPTNGHTPSERDVFRWTQLHNIGTYIYSKPSAKASTLLGSPPPGAPFVLAANGLICIGTDTGRVFVFDFKQTLKCICGDATSESTVGAVTAVALSHDHTFVAVGHATGHVQLFDLSKPQTPARSVPPTTLAAVASGRKEGHLQGSRIVSIGFVAGRHTAVVTADQTGLAFYHSLGKVLFVDASDVLRILGKYPDEEPQATNPNGNGATQPHFRRRRTRKVNTILAMAPLPLGTTPHPTDTYNIVALLTAAKLVIVGLKPSPKTWYRRHRDEDDEQMGKSKFRGSMAWFPSVASGAPGEVERSKRGSKAIPVEATTPMLVYSWGPTLNLLLVSETKITETRVNQRTGRTVNFEVGRISFEEKARWRAQGDVLAIQWLNANQILTVTSSSLEVYDVHTLVLVERVRMDPTTLVSPTLGLTMNGSVSYTESLGDVAHSVRTYKGKIFFLGRQEVTVGTLLTWADRVLAFVQDGDFLSAIDLTRSYYLGQAPGNKNGLPDNPAQLKVVVGEKLRELMLASMRYTFSEDRMSDMTHYTADGRGVDRTSLFENLVSTCARACIALDDFDFFFEDLFQSYDDAGIARIYLEQLELFVLDNDIRYVPPRITQRLIGMHADDQNPNLAERVIWHMDPQCLDINQAIHLCQTYQLYDALIYVYTRAMKDYVSPIVQMLGLVRKIMQYRREASLRSHKSSRTALNDEQALESDVVNAYKVYPYLANVLSGLTYPSEEPLEEEEASLAKHDVYAFLLHGRSKVWPDLDEGGTLILTSDEEGGLEPTYPYCRLLLRFDAEAFLHSLDLAFEDSYLNDEKQSAMRLVIVKILFEILSAPGLSHADATFVNIFIARNVAKYPHFILNHMTPSDLHSILVGLASDPDKSTQEDRQLAAEYLLSAYTPHESESLLHLFEEARFYRILRSWHRQEQQFAPLLLAYFHDRDLPTVELFSSAEDILTTAMRRNKGVLPDDLVTTISDSLPELLGASIADTAFLVDKHVPGLHEKALESMTWDVEHMRFAYLHCLLGPAPPDDEYSTSTKRAGGPSTLIPMALRQLYVSLQCQIDPTGVIPVLKSLPPDFIDWDLALRTCEEREVLDAVVWALNWKGDPAAALSKVAAFNKRLSATIGQEIASNAKSPGQQAPELQQSLSRLEGVVRTGVSVCLEHSRALSSDVPVEDFWFQLLRTQIDSVQSVSGCCSMPGLPPSSSDASDPAPLEQRTLANLRALVQETFSSLVSVSSSRGVSFPRLFKRLVEATSQSASGTPYTEFRTILTTMMDSYRSEGDILIITKHLLDRDVFETIEELSRERVKGWRPSLGQICIHCRQTLLPSKLQQSGGTGEGWKTDDHNIIISRTGAIYHAKCSLSPL